MSTPITEYELHAYVDDQLDPARRAEVQAWLLLHPHEHEQVRGWQEQRAALQRLHEDVLAEPVPLRLSVFKPAPRWPQALAAGIACLAVGLLAGWFARAAVTPPPGAATAFARQALAAHVLFAAEQRHPVEVPAEQEAHLVAWLSRRLDARIRAPGLQQQGFSLLGGRLLPGDQGPLAQLMYQSAQDERLTLMVRRAAAPDTGTGFRILEQGGATVFYWIDRDYGYALSGNIGRARMLEVARAVEAQLAAGTQE